MNLHLHSNCNLYLDLISYWQLSFLIPRLLHSWRKKMQNSLEWPCSELKDFLDSDPFKNCALHINQSFYFFQYFGYSLINVSWNLCILLYLCLFATKPIAIFIKRPNICVCTQGGREIQNLWNRTLSDICKTLFLLRESQSDLKVLRKIFESMWNSSWAGYSEKLFKWVKDWVRGFSLYSVSLFRKNAFFTP